MLPTAVAGRRIETNPTPDVRRLGHRVSRPRWLVGASLAEDEPVQHGQRDDGRRQRQQGIGRGVVVHAHERQREGRKGQHDADRHPDPVAGRSGWLRQAANQRGHDCARVAEFFVNLVLFGLAAVGQSVTTPGGLRIWGTLVAGILFGVLGWLALTPHAAGLVCLVVLPSVGLLGGIVWAASTGDRRR